MFARVADQNPRGFRVPCSRYNWGFMLTTQETSINKGNTNQPHYNPSTGESRYTVNGRSFHVYEARLDNIFTYIGYYFRLIFMDMTWEEHSIKINGHSFEFLVHAVEKNTIKQLEASASKTQKQSSKIYNPQNSSAPTKPVRHVLSENTNELNQSEISEVSDESIILDRPSLPDEWLLPAYTIPDYCDKGNIDSLRKVINEINLTAEVKINIKETSDGEIQLCHTEYEVMIFTMLYRDLLFDFFYNKYGLNKSCFNGYTSTKGLGFIRTCPERDLSKKLETQYSELPHQKPPEIVQPVIKNFSGKKEEIEKIFTSLLSQANGLIVGEVHGHLSPKEILIEQMQSLYEQGVRTLFLEHCCYDTLQEALDNFYVTKRPSEFIKNFLTHGCGTAVGSVDYYSLVNAAVLAGIRPVGLELSSMQKLGWDSFGGGQGKDRQIGMNVPAKLIIEREQGEGKYIALVGSAHVSYAENIAGLSELCGVPAMVITDVKKETDPQKYEKNQEHLGLDVKLPENSKLFNNTQGMVHFVHAHLTCTPKRT